jgi:hypothetical protein
MAKKNRIADNVSAVNAENAKTVNNLSKEEAVALANKTGAQPTAEMGEAELGNMVAANNQYNSKKSARENMPTDDDLDADLSVVDQQQINNATQEIGKMIGTPTYSSLTKEVEEDLNKTLLPTERKESHIEKLKRERAEKKAAKVAFHAKEKELINKSNYPIIKVED